MPEVVTAQSGPQGRASTSWDILQQPSPEEALGEQPKAEPSESSEKPDSSAAEPKPAAETNGQEQQQESEEPKDGEHKDKLSRYERTKRQKKALEARETALQQREKAFAESERARVAREEEARKPPYTVAELKQYRRVWANPGHKDYDPDLVAQADSEIARLEKEEAESRQIIEIPKASSPQFKEQWESAEKELYQLDPEFQREGTRLDKVLRQMMTGPDGAVYRQHPRGIVAAYHRARLAITEADLSAARGEIQKLKTELTRLNGLTSVGGSGGAGRSVADMRGKEFASMSTKEMRDYLKRNAARGRW